MAAGARPDSAATRHLFTSTAFLGVGSVLWLASMAAMRFPALFPISAGRLRPMAAIALFLGWLVLGLAGGVYYLLPRLTGASLRAEGLANLALAAAAGTFAVAIVLVGLGFGDGREPFAIPWWWDIPVLGILCVPALVTMGSLGERRESTVYPSLWFMVAGVTWLPVLYLIGNLPGLRSLAMALGDLVFTGGFLHVWALGVATGLAYYVVPKASGQPLANRQLARVGFWSLLFGAVWMGPVQLVAGPQPEWLQAVASVLGLAIPVASIANAVNLALTIGPEWKNIGRQADSGFGHRRIRHGGDRRASPLRIAGFRSAAVLVAFTPFWEGVIYLLVFGAVILLFASFRLAGHPHPGWKDDRFPGPAPRLVRRITFAAGGTFLFLVLCRTRRRVRMGGRRLQRTGRELRRRLGGRLPDCRRCSSGSRFSSRLSACWPNSGFAFRSIARLTSGRATIQEVLISDDESGLMSDLAAAAAAMGVPEALVKRSAEARAKATGASVDEILAAWAGGAPAPTASATAADQETLKPPAPERQPAASRRPPAGEPDPKPQTGGASSRQPCAPSEPPPAALRPAAPAAPPVLVGERQGIGVVMSGSLGLLVHLGAPLGLHPLACSNPATGSGPPTTRSHQRPLEGREIYTSQGCATCHTQLIRNVVADVGLGPVTLDDTNQVIGYRRIGPDLAAIGARIEDTAALMALLAGGGNHPAAVGLSEEDLANLVAYLRESR